MVEVVLFLISVWLMLQQIYWWQIKEYRLDRWWSWVRYNEGWHEFWGLVVRRPVVTWRTTVMGFVWVGLGLATRPWGWLLAAVIGPAVGAAITAPANWLAKTILMELAKRRVEQIQPKIISITGSYGKSSSKEVLAEILARKYRVVKTLANENTEIAIAKRILAAVKPGVEIFVMEVGAYRQGEIARVCHMAPPDIAWITAIGNQHLDLFGGVERLRQAKMEIVANLKPGGVAIVGQSQDLAIRKIARLLGIKKPTIRWPEVPVSKTPGGIQVVDKSYGVNQQGFERDIDYLKSHFSGKKYVVTPGIIELGEATARIHQQLAQKLSGLDGVFATSGWARRYLNAKDPQELLKALRPGGVVLIEGRIPSGLKQRILKL